jgi:hypothetical protein
MFRHCGKVNLAVDSLGMRPRVRSSGIGSFRGVCRQLVLDSNCFRGCHAGEFEALRSRGYSISLSIEALRETWANSIRQGKQGIVAQPLRRMRSVLDDKRPVAFRGGALFSLLETTGGPTSRASAEFRISVEAGVRTILAQDLTDEVWLDIGTQLEAELAGEKQQWNQRVAEAKEIMTQVNDTNTALGFTYYSKRRAYEQVWRTLVPPVRMQPRGEERFDAFMRFVSTKLINARNQQPQVNDLVDSLHLQHLAWPAFLVTKDFRLIEAVDATKTFQSAWVRTPVELVCDPICMSAPWGKPSRRIAQRFVRDPALRDRQQKWERMVRMNTG